MHNFWWPLSNILSCKADLQYKFHSFSLFKFPMSQSCHFGCYPLGTMFLSLSFRVWMVCSPLQLWHMTCSNIQFLHFLVHFHLSDCHSISCSSLGIYFFCSFSHFSFGQVLCQPENDSLNLFLPCSVIWHSIVYF